MGIISQLGKAVDRYGVELASEKIGVKPEVLTGTPLCDISLTPEQEKRLTTAISSSPLTPKEKMRALRREYTAPGLASRLGMSVDYAKNMLYGWRPITEKWEGKINSLYKDLHHA